MFFSLEQNINPRFSYHYNLGRLILNTDAGWHQVEIDNRVIIYKGYMDFADLSEAIRWIQDLQHEGNFCVFEFDRSTDQIQMKTSLYRSFLAWHGKDRFTNLISDEYTVWTDSTVSIFPDLSIDEKKINVIGKIDIEEISQEKLIELVHDRLAKRIKSFLKNNRRPLRVFCSGGVDSMLVFSYIKSFTDQFEIVWANHIEWDEFWCRNQNWIRSKFWGYQQIHHWAKPCVLSSGTPGDEFMLRSPITANLWLKYHDSSIPIELSKLGGESCLHKNYFELPKHLKIFKSHDHLPEFNLSKENFYWYLCNTVVNDCQHWHLGNTITFTPLRDLEIFKMFLRLRPEEGVDQILNSSISKSLIAKNDPSLLEYLSDKKNVGENYANLVGLMSRYSAVSGQ